MNMKKTTTAKDSRTKVTVAITAEIMTALEGEQRRALSATGYQPSMTRVAQRALEIGLGIDQAKAQESTSTIGACL